MLSLVLQGEVYILKSWPLRANLALKNVIVNHISVLSTFYIHITKICIIEVYLLKYYFESNLIYK